jgi:hypothetical protein
VVLEGIQDMVAACEGGVRIAERVEAGGCEWQASECGALGER